MTADQTPGDDPDRADRDAQREKERAATRNRQRAAYRQAQRDSRSRALRAAEPPSPAASRQADPSSTPLPVASSTSLWLQAERGPERSAAEPTAVELVEQRLEEAELQQALLSALAALPSDQRVAVVAALGYAEGSAGAAVELDVAPRDAEQLAQQGLAALRHALSPFLTRND